MLLQIVLQPQLYTIPLNFFCYYTLTLTNLVACWNLLLEQDLIFHYYLMNFLYNLSPQTKILRMTVKLTRRACGLLNEPDGGEKILRQLYWQIISFVIVWDLCLMLHRKIFLWQKISRKISFSHNFFTLHAIFILKYTIWIFQ